LITDQGSAPTNNDNIAIIAAGTFALGLLTTAMYFMMLRDDVTPSDVTLTHENTPSPMMNYYRGRTDQLRVQEGKEPARRPTEDTGVLVEPDPEEEKSLGQLVEDAGIDFNDLIAVPMEGKEQPAGIDFSNLEAVAKEQAEKESVVTDNVISKLQADDGSD